MEITGDYLRHLREQKEAELAEAQREHAGLLQALAQNQTRQHALGGQLLMLDDLLRTAAAETPPATE